MRRARTYLSAMWLWQGCFTQELIHLRKVVQSLRRGRLEPRGGNVEGRPCARLREGH